jgi:hypothetical protein
MKTTPLLIRVSWVRVSGGQPALPAQGAFLALLTAPVMAVVDRLPTRRTGVGTPDLRNKGLRRIRASLITAASEREVRRADLRNKGSKSCTGPVWTYAPLPRHTCFAGVLSLSVPDITACCGDCGGNGGQRGQNGDTGGELMLMTKPRGTARRLTAIEAVHLVAA